MRCLSRHVPGRSPWYCFLVRWPESPRRHGASERDQSARWAKALEAQFFLWARVAGRSAQSLARKGRNTRKQASGRCIAGPGCRTDAAALGRYAARPWKANTARDLIDGVWCTCKAHTRWAGYADRPGLGEQSDPQCRKSSGQFAGDRTIADYAREIWQTTPWPIPRSAGPHALLV